QQNASGLPLFGMQSTCIRYEGASTLARIAMHILCNGDDGSSPGTFRKVSRRRSIVAVALFARVFGDDVSSPWHAKG
ncbi:hypothetical protein J6590_102111, partial [Homalodisca vitripennis]